MMHGPLTDQQDHSGTATGNPLVAVLGQALALCNRVIVVFAAIALIAACVILSYSVLGRALFHSANYWQDEAAVFLLVGATFMTAAYVQGERGHIGIEAFVGLMSPLANRIRLWLVDVASLLFCAFFAWKSWTLAHEAWVDGQVSNSMWSPPLAIPYVLMALGMTPVVPADPAADHYSLCWCFTSMSVLGIGISYGLATLFAMFSGMPIAFALGAVAVVFMAIFMPVASLDTVTQNVYEEMASITLLSIPLFILKGAAIGKSRAGQDLYSALHAWLHRVPGGLGVANVFACALFAAMAGSSPATCSAIGSAGIPEMRKRGYSGGFAAGIIAAGGTLGILLPPSITMILFAVAAEKSLGRLFLAGIGPGLLLVTLFGIYAVLRFRKEFAAAQALYEKSGTESAILQRDEFTMAERFTMLPRVLPFVLLLTGVMIALYGGYATPSETAGLGGLLALVLIAVIYSVWRPSDLSPILKSTIRKSTMLMMIIGMSLLYSYVMSYLHISQSAAEAIVAMHLPRWELLTAILLMVVVLGFFLPPVSIILMTAPIILPPLRAANFDIIWFGVVMTIVMEMGLIHPPVGLNIFVIRNVAPDIPLSEVIWGTLPFVLLMMLAVLLLCFFPGISTGLPDLVMGPDGGR